MRFQVLMATSMKMTVFLNVAPYSLVETDRTFRGANCFHRLEVVLKYFGSVDPLTILYTLEDPLPLQHVKLVYISSNTDLMQIFI
jgi:hypothetical protein